MPRPPPAIDQEENEAKTETNLASDFPEAALAKSESTELAN